MENKIEIYRYQLVKLIKIYLLDKNLDLVKHIEVDLFIRDGIYTVGYDFFFRNENDDFILRKRLNKQIHVYLSEITNMVIYENFMVGWVKKYLGTKYQNLY